MNKCVGRSSSHRRRRLLSQPLRSVSLDEKVLFILFIFSFSRQNFLSPQTTVCRLHQRAGLALSRHHDGHGSHAGQGGGADLRGRVERGRHLRLGPRSPVGDGDFGAPQHLRRTPVGAGRPLVFAGRGAPDVVAGQSLQRVGLPGPQLVGVDDRAIRGRRRRVRVVEAGLEGVAGPGAGSDGGQRPVLGDNVRACVALRPRYSFWCLSVFPERMKLVEKSSQKGKRCSHEEKGQWESPYLSLLI